MAAMIPIVLLLFLVAVLTILYVSGASTPIAEYFAERFFKAKAKAEEKALEKAGEGEVEGFLKNQLKKNPMVSEGELNEIQSGLGAEAVREFGEGKGGGLGKIFRGGDGDS